MQGSVAPMDADSALVLLRRTAEAVDGALAELDAAGAHGRWAPLADGAHGGQHHSDVVADEAAMRVLDEAGVGVLSEETGLHRAGEPVTVVIDPLDGSSNAFKRIPWYAVSAAAVDERGVLAALVQNLATGERFEATRGGGARLDGVAIAASGVADPGDAMVGLNGYPPRHLGWKQFRAYGAGALDLCSVACGRLDAYVDCTEGNHGPWDYLAGMLIVTEAGGVATEALGRELVVLRHDARRAPIAAGTGPLCSSLRDARNESLGASSA